MRFCAVSGVTHTEHRSGVQRPHSAAVEPGSHGDVRSLVWSVGMNAASRPQLSKIPRLVAVSALSVPSNTSGQVGVSLVGTITQTSMVLASVGVVPVVIFPLSRASGYLVALLSKA